MVQLSADEVEVHAAVLLINNAVDDGNSQQTLETLQNTKANIVNVNSSLHNEYQNALYDAKRRKESHSPSSMQPIENADMYDAMLSRTDIQRIITTINGMAPFLDVMNMTLHL